MSFKLTIQKTPERTQQWVQHSSGARFLINGIGNKAYSIAIEKVADKSRGINLKDISEMDESPSEMMLESAGRYLIEDWQGIEMGEKGEEQIVPFTKDNGAMALANSFELWSFVLENARRIQLEADAEKEEVLGKSEPQQIGVEKNTRRSKTQSIEP